MPNQIPPPAPAAVRIALGRHASGDLVEGVRREWLATTGRGDYALGTAAGLATRRFTGRYTDDGEAVMSEGSLQLEKEELIAIAKPFYFQHFHGQHGVASATVAARLGLKCVVYMGSVDIERQAINVFRMKLLGAEVVPVTSGSKTLKDALNEAMRDWVSNIQDTFYIIGTAAVPSPYPRMVRDFNAVVGTESRAQMLAQYGRLPDAVIACVGGGSNAIGMFHPFLNDAEVNLIGAEAAGEGLATGKHAASLAAGVPGVLHGNRTYVICDDDGQITETHSISAGLDYPGVGPEHAFLKDNGRAQYVGVTDVECMQAFHLLARTEGILAALESAHAVAQAGGQAERDLRHHQ